MASRSVCVASSRGLCHVLNRDIFWRKAYTRNVERNIICRKSSSRLLVRSGASLNREENIQSPESSTPERQQNPSFLDRVKKFLGSSSFDRERLAKLGLGAVASYGFVSNVTYGAGVAVSWILFVKQTGKSPLMSGHWKAFLAFYAGFWTMQHFVRPLRFSVALAMAPLFDKFIDAIQERFQFSNRRDAFGVYLAVLGTLTSVLVFGSIRVFGGPSAFARTA